MIPKIDASEPVAVVTAEPSVKIPHDQVHVVTVSRGGYIGTGFVVGERIVLTASHVIEHAGPVRVNNFVASVIYADPIRDIALLRCDIIGMLSSGVFPKFTTDLRVDELVWAVGMFPFQHTTDRVVLRGWVADTHFGRRGYILLNGAAQGGLSGSPVVNKRAEVVGMLVAVVIDDEQDNPTQVLLVSTGDILQFMLSEEINAIQHPDIPPARVTTR